MILEYNLLPYYLKAAKGRDGGSLPLSLHPSSPGEGQSLIASHPRSPFRRLVSIRRGFDPTNRIRVRTEQADIGILAFDRRVHRLMTNIALRNGSFLPNIIVVLYFVISYSRCVGVGLFYVPAAFTSYITQLRTIIAVEKRKVKKEK